MNRTKLISAVVIVICMTMLFLISSTDMVLREQETPIYHISVILDDVKDEYYANFKKGVKQAFSEWKTDVNYVTLYDKNDAAQQLELIEREIENGAEAIILFPVENTSLNSYLEKKDSAVPVICVSTPAENGLADAYVHGDRKENGRKLAEQILLDMGEDKQNVYLLTRRDNRSGEQLMAQQGLAGRLEQSGINAALLPVGEEEEIPELIKSVYHNERKAYFVSLDVSLLETVMNDVPFVERSSLSFYCVGTTDRILYDISRGSIDGAVMANEFDLGYLSMQTAISLLEKKKAERETIAAGLVVTRDNLYDKEIEKLAFPIE